MPRKHRRKPLPDTEINAKITGISHEGRGITHIDGKTTFVLGALPGESVKFRYTRMHSAFDEALVTEIIQASENRLEAKCPHFLTCGGCSLQHLNANAQIEHKTKMVLELLQHQANVVPKNILPAIQGSSWNYRRKARLSVKYVPKKGKVLVGFRERQARYVADLSRCEILAKPAGELIVALSELIFNLTIKNAIPQIEICAGDDATALIFRHLKPLTAEDQKQLIEFCKLH
ncbi:MAG: 23S rRNA (uracil(1939)-C(5))-methyltransferase, partial [Gammaproteobacteria bacterium]|nr:23S rRNA (uracil(1939)-C(5))-methyltransferase [Gammaproteobacteria bacterium]